jgi:hypothetical protein
VTPNRLFELRTYHAAPGKLAALQARFANHTLGLFARHGLTVVGFWVARDANGQPGDDLVYLLASLPVKPVETLGGLIYPCGLL